MRRIDHRPPPSVAFFLVALTAFVVISACAAHGMAVTAGWVDALPGEPFSPVKAVMDDKPTDRAVLPRGGLDAWPAHTVVTNKVVGDQVRHRADVNGRHSDPKGHAYGHWTGHPRGHAYGWAHSHGRALAKGFSHVGSPPGRGPENRSSHGLPSASDVREQSSAGTGAGTGSHAPNP